jgi:CBS domain-containing protein
MTPGADLAHIVALMLDKHLEWVPIVDGQTVVGVITPADLAQASYPLPRPGDQVR